MDFIRRRQLRVYFVSRDDYADLLQFALSERGDCGSRLSGVLGLCRFGFHADRGAERTGAGHAGRLSGTEEKNICAVRDGRRVRAGGLVDPDFVESVSDSLYRGEGWLFRQPDFLRFNAIRRHDAGADGPGFLAWLRLGLHRQLCSVCDQSGLRSVLRAVFDDDHDGDDSGVCDQCAVVAGLHAAVIEKLQAELLC